MPNAEKLNQPCFVGNNLDKIEILSNFQVFNSVRGPYGIIYGIHPWEGAMKIC